MKAFRFPLRASVWCSALMSAACAVPAFAQSEEPAAAAEGEATQLAPVVVTAAGFEQKITDAPASISVITREQLESRSYITLLDAVRDLEGVDVGETDDKTGQGTISMRGMGSDYTLILIDGRRQNNNGDLYPNNFGGNQFNHIPPLAAIERIEVIRGPASTLYGADAIGGVINIITRKVTDRWMGTLSQSFTFQEDREFGDDRTTELSLMGPIVPGKLGLALRGNLYDREPSNPAIAPAIDPNGEAHDFAYGFGGGGRTVENRILGGGFTLNFTPTQRHDLVFTYDTSEQEYDNDESQLGTADNVEALWRSGNAAVPNPDYDPADPGSPATITRRVVQPRAGYSQDQLFTRDQWSLTHVGRWDWARSEIGLSYVESGNHGRTQPLTVEERVELQDLWNDVCARRGQPANCNNGTGADGIAASNLTDAELARLQSFLPRPKRVLETRQYTLDAKLDFSLGDHFIVVGGQWIDGEMEDSIFGFYGGGYVEGETQDHEMWALFAEDNWTVVDGLTVTAGLRYDKHEVFGDQTSPRLYAVYTVNDAWTVKGGVSTGYKTPKTSDLFPGIRQFGGQGVIPFVGNPTLEPETSVNTEVAVYFDSPAGHNFNLTLFRNEFKDKISSGGDTIPPCEIAQPGQRCADVGIGWVDLGYSSFTQSHNIDRVDLQGLEAAGRYQLPWGLALRANYTYTDSEQKSGPAKGQPLNLTAKHMANAFLEWDITAKWDAFLQLEVRSARYRGWEETLDRPIYYRDYEMFHLGSSYKLSDHVRLNARVNNLLDHDFTTHKVEFTPVDPANPSAGYNASFLEDYNNAYKARSYWLGVTLEF